MIDRSTNRFGKDGLSRSVPSSTLADAHRDSRPFSQFCKNLNNTAQRGTLCLILGVFALAQKLLAKRDRGRRESMYSTRDGSVAFGGYHEQERKQRGMVSSQPHTATKPPGSSSLRHVVSRADLDHPHLTPGCECGQSCGIVEVEVFRKVA